MTPTELVKLVQDAPGSMYTREDVINLLNKVEAPTANATISDEVMGKIIGEVMDVLELTNWDDHVEKEFSCDTYGSEATITCEVTIDIDDVVNDVRRALKDLDLNENN